MYVYLFNAQNIFWYFILPQELLLSLWDMEGMTYQRLKCHGRY